MTDRPIDLIAHTGPGVGAGHAMRCLALYKTLRQHGHSATLYSTDPAAAPDQFRRAGSGRWTAQKGKGLVVLDHRFGEVRSNLAAAIDRDRLVIIDDTAKDPVACQCVINPNPSFQNSDYRSWPAAIIKGGLDWIMIPEAFERAFALDPEQDTAVVSFGGSDDGSLAAKVCKLLADATPLQMTVPVLSGQTLKSGVFDALKDRVDIKVDSDMAALLGGSEWFVGAAGQTALQAMASGCRVVVAPTANDQHSAYLALLERGASPLPDPIPGAVEAFWAECHYNKPSRVPIRSGLPRIAQFLKDLINDGS